MNAAEETKSKALASNAVAQKMTEQAYQARRISERQYQQVMKTLKRSAELLSK